MRLFPKQVNTSYPLWFAYTSLVVNLAIGVLWLVFEHGHRLCGLFWLAIAAAWAWVSEAVRRGQARQRHDPGQTQQP